MDLHAKVRLADPETVGDGRGGHPDVDAETGDIRAPYRLLRIEPRNLPGEREIAADGLAYSLAVQSAGEVIDNVVCDGTVVFVPHVHRRHKLKTPLQHGLQEILYPVGGDASDVRIHNGAHLDIEPVRSLEHRSQGGAFAARAAVDGDELFLPGLDLKFPRNFP